MKQNKVAVFGDLTALYNARTELKKNINYALLDRAIKNHCKVPSLACAKWYTLFHPNNQSQVNFVKTLETECNWEIHTKRPSEVRRSTADKNPHNDYRFDAQIAYDIGAATGEEYDSIVVVSDSLELLKPLKDAIKFFDAETPVELMFFSDAMDRRWWRALPDSGIKFTDLGELMHSAVAFSPRFEKKISEHPAI